MRRFILNSPWLRGLTYLLLSSGAAHAACDTSADPVQTNTSCDDMSISTTKSNVTIGPSAPVSPFFSPLDAVHIYQAGNITGTFVNQGTITSGFGNSGFVNQGRVSAFINAGLITTNSINRDYAAVVNNNEIGTFINQGTISSTTGNFGSGSSAILQNAHIGTLYNTGLISAQNRAIYFQPGSSARIDTLINAGTIQGGINGSASSTYASAIELGPGSSIGSVINFGTIDHSVCDAGGTCYAAIHNAGGSIGSITNYGTLSSGNTGSNAYGIINSITGRIGALSNAQGNLRYSGTLPDNYNVIINSPSGYGKLDAASASGQTVFGIAAGSAVTNTTYASVLTGLTAGNLANTSGTYGGGLVQTQWVLNNPTGMQWDLSTTSTAVAPNTGSASGNKLAQAISFAYTAAPASVVLSNGSSFVGAVQSLTPANVSALSRAHAEGYSSNMTINLEQMGHVTNAVMDRIQAPLAGQTGMSTSLEVDQGNYLWADASTMRGSVDSYNALSGFGYQLTSLILGKDLLRSAAGGVGVFGGVGMSSMTQSDQVTQDFTSDSLYLGVYGGKYLAHDFKLSGAAGYVHSDTNAKRQNPDIGNFTGGAATSNYASNGLFGAVKLSRPFAVAERVTLTPFAGASYSRLQMNQTNESGGKDFNYAIASGSGNSAVTFVGGEFLIRLSERTADPLLLTGFYRYGYDWSADNDASHQIQASSPLYGVFTQTGANKGSANNLAGLGLQGHIARGVSVRAGIVGRTSTHGTESGGGAEITWEL